jgi:hypothetical protein
MSLRSDQILLLEKVAQECAGTLAKAIYINQLILQNRLPVTPLDLHAIHATLRSTEEMLRNMELRARGVTYAAGLS